MILARKKRDLKSVMHCPLKGIWSCRLWVQLPIITSHFPILFSPGSIPWQAALVERNSVKVNTPRISRGIVQDSPSRFHAIPKPVLRMRVWWLWKCVIESTCLVSLHLVQARMLKTCPKKVNKKRKKFCTLNPSFNVKKKLYFTFPLRICTFLWELGNEAYTFYHLYTFQFNFMVVRAQKIHYTKAWWLC